MTFQESIAFLPIFLPVITYLYSTSHGKRVICFSKPYFKVLPNIHPSIISNISVFLFLGYTIFKLYFFFFLFRATPAAYMEVPRWGVESELQLPAYTTVIAMPDPSHICELQCSSQQCQILNLLSRAKHTTCLLRDTSQVRSHCATVGTPKLYSHILKLCT